MDFDIELWMCQGALRVLCAPYISNGERRTRPTDAHSPRRMVRAFLDEKADVSHLSRRPGLLVLEPHTGGARLRRELRLHARRVHPRHPGLSDLPHLQDVDQGPIQHDAGRQCVGPRLQQSILVVRVRQPLAGHHPPPRQGLPQHPDVPLLRIAGPPRARPAVDGLVSPDNSPAPTANAGARSCASLQQLPRPLDQTGNDSPLCRWPLAAFPRTATRRTSARTSSWTTTHSSRRQARVGASTGWCRRWMPP